MGVLNEKRCIKNKRQQILKYQNNYLYISQILLNLKCKK